MSIPTEVIHREAMRLGISSIAGHLQQVLGQRLAGFLAGLKDEKMVGRWASGQHVPHELPAARLRAAYQAVRLLEGDGQETTRAWFMGANPFLGDRAPALVLRQATGFPQTLDVVPAARAFAGAE